MLENNSAETSAFPELFEFVMYDKRSASFRETYTSYSKNIILGTTTYISAPISRSNFSKDVQFKNTSVTVIAPLSNIVLNYIANNPLDKVYVNIYKANSIISGSTNGATSSQVFRVIFRGVIKNILIENRIANIACEEDIGIFRRRIPNIFYQNNCNHELFDNGCKLSSYNFDLYANNGLVTSMSSDGRILYLSNIGGYDENYFKGGYLYRSYYLNGYTWGTYRLITRSTSSSIYLHIPLSRDHIDEDFGGGLTYFEAGSFRLVPGCDGSPKTCKEKFNNYENFLGMPLIPSHNPVIWGFK